MGKHLDALGYHVTISLSLQYDDDNQENIFLKIQKIQKTPVVSYHYHCLLGKTGPSCYSYIFVPQK